MKISVVQAKAVAGDIPANLERHKKMIAIAAGNGADIIIFPELSLTGYEPTLAGRLAVSLNDERLDDLQKISDVSNILIGVGAPLRAENGIWISMLLFQPRQERQVYSKKYLHADEEAFFVSGNSSVGLIGGEAAIALAICYEISISQHVSDARHHGAKRYIASVAKSASGLVQAVETLSQIASQYAMPVLLSSCIGYCDNFEAGGKSSVWNSSGRLIAQLDDMEEGFIIFDTEKEEAYVHRLTGFA